MPDITAILVICLNISLSTRFIFLPDFILLTIYRIAITGEKSKRKKACEWFAQPGGIEWGLAEWFTQPGGIEWGLAEWFAQPGGIEWGLAEWFTQPGGTQ
jgi:hypothetical protein